MKKCTHLLMLLFLASCKTYYVAPADLVRQLKTAKITDVTVSHSLTEFTSSTYKSNGVTALDCFDKNGVKHALPITPAVEMRLTDTNGKRRTFYFDTVNLEDSMLEGSISRILNAKKKINIGSIRKVEVQNGGKDYHYRKSS